MFGRITSTNSSQRWLALAVSVSVAFIGSVKAQPIDSSLTIRLMREVSLRTSTVKLSDIAEIRGSDEVASKAGELIVAENIPADSKHTIRSWRVSQLLSSAEFDLTKVVLTGSAMCDVSVIALPSEALDGVAHRVRRNSRGPVTLEDRIHQTIRDHIKGLGKESRVTVRFVEKARPILALTDPPYTFRIRLARRNKRWIGQIGLRIELLKDRMLVRELVLVADVEVRAVVFRMVRTVNSKALVSKMDVERVWVDVTRQDASYVTDFESFVGARAKRVLRTGVHVETKMLEPLPMAARNQMITVIYRNGALEVKMTARAMESGFKGEMIRVRNERSKEIFVGKLIRPGVVLVDQTSAMGMMIADGRSGGARQ